MRDPQNTKRRVVQSGASVAVILSSAVLFSGMVKTRPRAQRRSAAATIPAVEVMEVRPQTFRAPIVAYGTVRPQRRVEIIPEISGQLTAAHPLLATGNVIPQGALLFKIDTRPQESKAAQVRAEIERLRAELRRHQQQQQDLVQRLALAQQQVELARNSVERERRLLDKDSTTLIEYEAVQQRFLKQQEAVLAYRSQLDAIPGLLEENAALLELKQAQLREVQLSIDKGLIICPFDARVDRVSAQVPQVVVAGTPITALTDVGVLELAVAVDPRDLHWIDDDSFRGAGPDRSAKAAAAQVSWVARDEAYRWSGPVTRIERLDEATRTTHVVIELRNDKIPIDVGDRYSVPSIGMFCRAELPTATLANALVVPRSAIHDGQYVYVFEPGAESHQGRLRIKRIAALRRVDDQVLVGFAGSTAGLSDEDSAVMAPRSSSEPPPIQTGDGIITSPLPKAIEGMALRRRAPSTVHPGGAATQGEDQ